MELSRQEWSWRWRILISTYLGYAGYYLTRKLFTISKKPIAESLGWELADTAHLWTAFLLGYMLGQFLCGWLGRKRGPRWILLGGLGCSILFNAALGFAQSYPAFLFFMFWNGLVQASGWPGVVGTVSCWLREHERGRYMGIWSTSYSLGNLAVKYLGGLGLAYLGWRTSFVGLSLVTVGIWMLLYVWQRNRPEDVGLPPVIEPARSGSAEARREYWRLLTNPVVLTMGLGYFCLKFLRYALDSWLPSFLALRFQLSPALAAGYSSLFDSAGLLGAACAGWLLDKVFQGRWTALALALAVGMVAGYWLILQWGTTPARVALGCGLVGFMLYGPDMLLSGAGAVEVGGPRDGIAVAGIVNGLGSLGPIVQEEVVGALLRAHSVGGVAYYDQLALSVSCLFALMMMVLNLLPRRLRPRAD